VIVGAGRPGACGRAGSWLSAVTRPAARASSGGKAVPHRTEKPAFYAISAAVAAHGDRFAWTAC
jgi:hypothetical protein